METERNRKEGGFLLVASMYEKRREPAPTPLLILPPTHKRRHETPFAIRAPRAMKENSENVDEGYIYGGAVMAELKERSGSDRRSKEERRASEKTSTVEVNPPTNELRSDKPRRSGLDRRPDTASPTTPDKSNS